MKINNISNLNKNNMVIERNPIIKNNYGKILPNKFAEYSEEELNFLNELLGNSEIYDYTKPINVGDVIEAKVGGESATHYLFDISGKDYIYVEKKKQETEALYRYVSENSSSIDSNTVVKVQITSIQESPYMVTGSLSSLEKTIAFNEFIDDETPILGKVVSASSAGVVVELSTSSKTSAFCPSFMCGLNKLSAEQIIAMNGNSYYFIVDHYSEDQGTYIVSRKAYIQQLAPQAISELVTRDENNKLLPLNGTITGTCLYGIFVELDNPNGENVLTGMIHNTALNDTYKEMLSKGTVVAGERIDFFVKEIVDQKLVLAQVIRETLWDTIKVGDVFNNIKVLDVKSTGYLVELDNITKGLINPNEALKLETPIVKNDILHSIKVVAVNRNIRKIFLSII